jgi:hypothetical protein
MGCQKEYISSFPLLKDSITELRVTLANCISMQANLRRALAELFCVESQLIANVLKAEKNFVLTTDTLFGFYVLKARFDTRQTLIFEV